MTTVGWIAVIVVGVGAWIVSGWVVKVVGFVARLVIRLLIVAALLALGVHLYHKMTNKPISTVEWNA